MSGRQILAQALGGALPGWQIVADARALDGVRKPGAIVLFPITRKRPDLARLSLLQDELGLWVLTAADKPSVIEDDLDDLLEAVIGALEPLDAFVWTEATRGVLDETWHGWRLTVICNYKIEGA